MSVHLRNKYLEILNVLKKDAIRVSEDILEAVSKNIKFKISPRTVFIYTDCYFSLA